MVKRKQKSVLSGKGFYIALTLSVAMVGTACYFAYTQTSQEYTGEVESGFGVASETDAFDAAGIQTDVTKYSKPEISATTVTTVSEIQKSEITTTEETKQAAAVKQQTFKLIMPVNNEIISEYSNGELVKSATTGAWQTHNGIDIKAAAGDKVISAAAGKVSSVENNPLWGVTVSIDHGNGVVTRYCNLNSGVTVSAGQQVGQGEEIGAVGSTADIESKLETHLHFEAVKNGSFVNPVDLM